MGRWSSSEREQSPLPKTGLEESKRGEASGGNPPESPFRKGGELLLFLKGEREGF